MYWLLTPPRLRRNCIFRVSCSKYVYSETKRHGFLAGMEAFANRWKTCRPGYEVCFSDNRFRIILVNGQIVDQSEISDHIIQQNYNALHGAEEYVLKKYQALKSLPG